MSQHVISTKIAFKRHLIFLEATKRFFIFLRALFSSFVQYNIATFINPHPTLTLVRWLISSIYG